jgi:hypothetical protein
MQTRIETSRLILRPFQLSDAQSAFEWFADPVVMRFTPTGPDKSTEETITRLAGYQNHQGAHGFSKWLILERDSGAAIGDSGLSALPEYGWVDLGFRFAQPYWGKGLATEVASGMGARRVGRVSCWSAGRVCSPQKPRFGSSPSKGWIPRETKGYGHGHGLNRVLPRRECS